MPSADDFRKKLAERLRAAELRNLAHVDVNASELHREVGVYPNGGSHQMPNCCRVMYEAQKTGDRVLAAPPKGNGASLTIRYRLPR